MKVLIIGAESEYSIEKYYLKYFKEQPDMCADIFAAQNIFLSFYQKNHFNKIIYRLGYKRIFKKIENLIKDKVIAFAPQVVFIFKGMEVTPELIRWIKRKGIKIVNYNPDNPFIFSGRGSGNSNVTKSVGLYDVHFTYNHEVKNLIDNGCKIKTFILPFGYDVTEDVYKQSLPSPEILKVCFIGTADSLRATFLTELALKGIEIDVYGSNWKKFINHKKITINDPVWGDEMWKTLSRYRIQLNPLRKHNLNSHAMRSFEIPGIGGIMLAPRTSEHLQYFLEDKEAFYYGDVNEAISKIGYILALSTYEANKIRLAARERSISSGYHYRDRAQFVYDIFMEL